MYIHEGDTFAHIQLLTDIYMFTNTYTSDTNDFTRCTIVCSSS